MKKLFKNPLKSLQSFSIRLIEGSTTDMETMIAAFAIMAIVFVLLSIGGFISRK